MATILIVDDEAVIVDLLGARLQKHGYNVLGANNGVKALEVLAREQNRVDLIITGIQMPKMNGLELGEHLRTAYPKVPVIYMSGYMTENVMKEIRKLRNTRVPEDCAFLPKPFSEEKLIHTVRTVLSA